MSTDDATVKASNIVNAIDVATANVREEKDQETSEEKIMEKPDEKTHHPPLYRPPLHHNINQDRKIHNLPQVGIRYTQLCRRLNLDEEFQRKAWVLLQRLVLMNLIPEFSDESNPASTSEINISRIWAACCIFIVGVFQAKGPQNYRNDVQGTGVKLNNLLKCTGITVSELFNNVETAIDACGPCVARAFDSGYTQIAINYIVNLVIESLKHLKHNYVVMTVFFEKFTFLWDISRNFAGNLDARAASVSENASTFAWLLFVVARHRLYGKDHLALANLYNLLVATINYARFGKSRNFEDKFQSQLDVTETSKLSESELKLARFAKIEPQDMQEMSESVLDLVESLLKEGVFGTVTEGQTPLLPHNVSSPTNTEKLSRYYDNRYVLSVCDFDERVFLDPRLHRQLASTPQRPKSKAETRVREATGASALHRGGKESQNFAKTGNEAKASKRQLFTDNTNYGTVYNHQKFVSSGTGTVPATTKSPTLPVAASPMRPPRVGKSPAPHGTPVSGAVEANNWLRRELQDAPDKPSNTLRERYFRECEENPEEAIVKRLESFRVILNREYKESGPAGVINFDDDSPKEKPSMSVRLNEHLDLVNKLYYRTLESILRGESERLKTCNFDTLLNNGHFHSSLYVWCLEVILRSKEILKLMYPKSAKVLKVGSLDLIKIVDCFIKYVPALPRISRQHIYSIEENIMEEAAWRSDSIVQIIEIMKRDKTKSPQQSLFLRKLYTLAHYRIRKLCVGLFSSESTTELMRLIFTTFRYAVSRYPELLQDRHVDHVILCSVYGISKIKAVKPDVSFKRINQVYKSQRSHDPHSYNKVIRDIVLGFPGPLPRTASTSSANTATSAIPPTPPIPYKQQQAANKNKRKGDVIKFYNQIFLPRMKRYLLDLKHSSTQTSNSTPKSGAGGSSSLPLGLQTPTKSSASPMIHSVSGASYATNAAAWLQSPLRGPHPSPHRLSGSNVYLSPRRTIHDSPVRMTPRTRALYAFGESPARDLHLINRAVTAQRRSRLRRGPSLDDDDVAGEQSAKRARIDRIETLLRPSTTSTESKK